MKKFRTIVCVFLILVMAAALVSCNGKNKDSDKDGGKKPSLDDYVTIKIGFPGQMGRLFAGLTPTENNLAADAMYDVFFRADPATKEIFSYCLDDWYWEDNTTFIMVLREGVMFSNGAEATAEDVVYSYTSYFDRGSSQLNDYKIIWDECYARDKYTAVIKMEEFYAPFEQWMVYLHNKEWCESVGWDSMDWFNPVVSGPYYCSEYAPDQHIYLKARDDYWDAERRGAIYVDEFQIISYPDQSAMYLDLETGKLDICSVLSANYSRYLKQGGEGFECILLPIGTNMNFYFCYLNNDIWYNPKLREALTIGVDWDAIGRAALQDNFIPAKGICPEASPDFIDVGWGDVPFDPERAIQMLDELGYNASNPLKLYAIGLSGAMNETCMETLQYFYSQLGVELGIEFSDIATVMDIWRTRAGEPYLVDVGFHHSRRGSSSFEMRMSIMYARMAHQSLTWVDDESGQFVELYTQLVANPDADVRHQAALDLQQLVRDNYIMVPVAEYAEALGYNTNLFTAEQVNNYVNSSTVYQLSRLGLLSAWE